MPCRPGARASACALLALFVGGCALFTPRFQRPELALERVDLRGGNLFAQTMRLRVRIDNPNDRALPVERVLVRLSLDGRLVASGTTDAPFVVPANGEARFDMTVNANLAAGLAELARGFGPRREAIDYTLDGVVRLDLPMFRSLPFHETGRWPPDQGGGA
ncbi:MAG: LEA type 2 family protein [Gammaproteobacteria bacterium]|nr:LEA type 2 family protein [Gammaproteobacteria bacterium]